jgi:hypothetical protein
MAVTANSSTTATSVKPLLAVMPDPPPPPTHASEYSLELVYGDTSSRPFVFDGDVLLRIIRNCKSEW